MEFHKEIKILFVILMAITFASVDTYSIDYSGSDVVGIESIVDDITTPSDETWRLEANQRIDQTRKADMDIVVLDELTGFAIPDVEIDVKLTRHQFRFGGVTRAKTLEGVDASITEQLYKDTFLSMGFNASGFNNAFKMKQESGQGPYIAGALQWLHDQNVEVRGHCLIWPGTNSGGSNHLTPTVAAALDGYNADPQTVTEQQLRDLIDAEMVYWAGKWDVVEWDVINEERGNHDLMDVLGEDVMVGWFNLAQQNIYNPNALLYLNENRVISDTASGIHTSKIDEYIATIDNLLAKNAALTGLGFQSRFGSMLSAETIYDRLCLFNDYNLPIAATEFEMKDTIGTELNMAEMTERVMTVYFSHHLVNGIYAWSFFPGDNRAVVDLSGVPNLRGKTWLYLMKKHWMTDETVTSDATGSAFVRGFKGDYDITVQDGAETKTVQVTLDSNSTFTISIGDPPPPISFEPTDDAYVKGTSTSNNYGDKEKLELRSITGNWPRMAYLKFSVSGLTGPVDSAILYLYSNTQVGVVDAFAVTDTAWSEDTITWDTKPDTGSLIASGNAAANVWFQIDISSYITGNGTYAIALETPVNSSMGELSSKEGANPPVLDITVGAVDWCQVANLNGVMPIDMNDFAMIASNWQLNGTNLSGDINKDGHVNAIDLKIVVSYWLSDCGQE